MLPTAGGGATASGEGSGPTSGVSPALVSDPSSGGGARAVKDGRVRRDRAVRSRAVLVHSGATQPVAEAAVEVTPRGHVQGDCQGGRGSNGNGGRRVEDGEGDWAPPPLQASTQRAHSRLRTEVADLGEDSAKRKVEVIREREEAREGWKADAAAAGFAKGHTRKRHPRRGPDCIKAPVPDFRWSREPCQSSRPRNRVADLAVGHNARQ